MRFRSYELCLGVLTTCVVAGTALAQSPASPANPSAPAKNDTVHGYAQTAPDCLAWSDGCVICARDEKSAPHCSTPGIACIPVAVSCKVSKSQ